MSPKSFWSARFQHLGPVCPNTDVKNPKKRYNFCGSPQFILNYLKTMLARKLRISPFDFLQNSDQICLFGDWLQCLAMQSLPKNSKPPKPPNPVWLSGGLVVKYSLFEKKPQIKHVQILFISRYVIKAITTLDLQESKLTVKTVPVLCPP